MSKRTNYQSFSPTVHFEIHNPSYKDCVVVDIGYWFMSFQVYRDQPWFGLNYTSRAEGREIMNNTENQTAERLWKMEITREKRKSNTIPPDESCKQNAASYFGIKKQKYQWAELSCLLLNNQGKIQKNTNKINHISNNIKHCTRSLTMKHQKTPGFTLCKIFMHACKPLFS